MSSIINPLRTDMTVTLVGAPSSEFFPRFVQRMVDAMGLSFFKYGPVAQGYPKNVDAIASLEVRLQRYKETGNKRWLVDVANFAMIETEYPRHPNAHDPEHDDASPGRVDNAGTLSEVANTPSQEAKRDPRTAPSWMRHEGD